MNTGKDVKGVIVIEGHVQGLANTRALGEAGIPVIVVSQYNCLARYSRYCKKFFRCPGYLSGDFIGFLVDLALAEGLHGWILLPSNDHAVFNISANKEKLSGYYKVIAPGTEILESIYNKELLIQCCMSVGVPVPLSWFPQSVEKMSRSVFEFPLLIKGKNGLTFYKSTGKKAFLVNSAGELEPAIQSITEKSAFTNIYLQNLVPVEKKKPVSFTAFSVKGEIKSYWMGVKVREHPLQFGTATCSRSIDHPELKPLAEKILKKLAYTGVCEIEFLFDPRDQQYKLIEVNARTWLWVDMAIQGGVNYPLMIYNFLNSIEMDYPENYPIGKEWIHYLTDLPYSISGILKGYYPAGEIIKSYIRFPQAAVLKFTDILPSFAEIALLPSLMLKR